VSRIGPDAHPVPDVPRVDETELTAYCLDPTTRMRLVPAPAARKWMAATPARFANRCLPLLIANQAGWFVVNGTSFRAVWSGGASLGAVTIEYLGPQDSYSARSHFGCGIVTWTLPYLFRTPPGYNLLVRGPANWPKDGACALEGIVETDWSPATFTMNWKLTRPDLPVSFTEGEPICMILPQRRGELERVNPRLSVLEADRALQKSHGAWEQSRRAFLRELRIGSPDSLKPEWQRHYFQGTMPDGVRAPDHQTKLTLREFTES
jgi:hypothetical protein